MVNLTLVPPEKKHFHKVNFANLEVNHFISLNSSTMELLNTVFFSYFSMCNSACKVYIIIVFRLFF